MSVLSDLSSGAVGGLLGGIGTLAKDIRVAITGVDPQKAAEIELKLTEMEAQAMNAQAQINIAEAGSEHWFVAAWRPFIGWSCGLAFIYAAILEPLARFIAKVGFDYKGEFPVIDTMLTMQVLIGMLGLGAYRSFDKKQTPNVAGKE